MSNLVQISFKHNLLANSYQVYYNLENETFTGYKWTVCMEGSTAALASE